MGLLKKINGFIDDRFEHPRRWKFFLVLFIVGLLFTLFPSGNTNTKVASTRPKTTDKVDYSEVNQFIDDMDIVVGDNDNKDEALEWLNTNKALYNDELHRSKRYLYLDLVSKARGGFTKEAAQYACEKCDYDFKDNAVYWADQFASIGFSDNDIQRELGQMQRFGGGFIDSEAKNAVNSKTSSYVSSTQIYQISALTQDELNSGSNDDVDACKKVLAKWLDKDGYSKRDLAFYLTTYCDFTKETVDTAIEETSIDYGLQASKVLSRFKDSELSKEKLTSIAYNLNNFPAGESKWAAEQYAK